MAPSEHRKRVPDDGWITIEAPGQSAQIYAKEDDEVTVRWEPDGEANE